MSRSRAITVPTGSNHPVSLGTSKDHEKDLTVYFSSIAGPASWNNSYVTSDYQYLSSMVDNTAPITVPLDVYKGCDHQKIDWASHKAEWCYEFNPPTPPLYAYLSLNPAPTVPSISGLSWNSNLDDLAAQLQRGSENSFQALVFIAEARKTWEMIKNPLSVLSPLFRKTIHERERKLAIKQNIFRSKEKVPLTSRLLDTTTGIWLSGRYGWKPFLKDVESFSQLSANLLNSSLLPKYRERFSSRTKDVQTLSTVYPQGKTLWDICEALGPESWSNPRGCQYRLVDRSVETKLNVMCWALDPLDQITNHLGRFLVASGATASWRNIRDVIWETLPFSFVIDWFIDFSNIWRPLNERTILQKAGSMVGYSAKVTARHKVEFLLCKPTFATYLGSTPWYNKTCTRAFTTRDGPTARSCKYTRMPGLPNSSSEIFTSRGLNLIHGIDGISLFLQRLLVNSKQTRYR